MAKTVKRVGVIGGGQLAWMMGGGAKSLGLDLVIQTPQPTDPAVSVASDTIFAPIDDAAATAKLAAHCDVITFENEFINLDALFPLANQGVCFRPRLDALAPLLDKYNQRCYLRDIGLPQPAFNLLETPLNPDTLTFPLVLKARRHGYDGQGTFIFKDRESFQELWQKLADIPLLVEEFIPFERELAVIAARSVSGEVMVYPVVETQQENQVCRRVIIPAPISPEIEQEINAIARTLLNSLQAVGVFGIELFLTANNQVYVNEVSPRTHNSGHFSLDACETSQFEMHLRAVAGLLLTKPTLNCIGAVMINLLGYEYSQNDYLEKRQKLASQPQTYVHWYGKKQSRPGRKLGHVTVLLDSSSGKNPQAIAQTIETLWYG
jgi:5-(carboxyamino)imidazole ribonucleotide synthase